MGIHTQHASVMWYTARFTLNRYQNDLILVEPCATRNEKNIGGKNPCNAHDGHLNMTVAFQGIVMLIQEMDTS